MKKLLILWLLATAQLTVPQYTTRVAHAQVMTRAAVSQFTPSLNLDFTKGVMPAGVSFSRASIGTRVNASGVLETITANNPRFDYDPVTLAPKGLLIEESRTNLIANSANGQGNIASLQTGLSATNNGTGTENGFPYVEITITGTATSGGYCTLEYGGYNGTAGSTYTHSFYLKNVSGVVGPTSQVFGVGGSSGWGSFGLFQVAGFARYSQAGTVTSTGQVYCRYGFRYDIGVPINQTFRLYAPQAELGSFATSYIPTTSAAVTRAQDFASMSNLSFYNIYEGTFYIVCDYLSWASNPGYNGVISFGSGNIILQNGQWRWEKVGDIYKGGNNFLVKSRIMASYNPTTISATSLGVTQTITANSNSPMTSFLIGCFNGGSGALNGHMYNIQYWPKSLPLKYQQVIAP